MNFPLVGRNSCFIKNCSLMLLSLAILTWVSTAQAETPADAAAQVQVWKAEAARLTKQGKTAEAAQAQAYVQQWEELAKGGSATTTSATTSTTASPATATTTATSTDATNPAQQAALKAQQERLAAEQAKRDEAKAKEDRLSNGLEAAITQGDYNQAKNFINQGARPTQELVQMAVDGGYTGIAYLLMKSGAPNDAGVLGRALLKAVQMQDRDRVNNLIKLGANANYSEGEVTPLSIAARNGDIGLIGILLAAGAQRDPNDLGRVMFTAVEQGEREKVANLLKMGANPNYAKDGESALSLSLTRGDFGMAGALIAGGAAADGGVLGKALFQTVERGEADKIPQLIKLGADVNYSASGVTPLTIAINNNNLEIANILVRSGATDPSGRFGKKTFDAALDGDLAWIAVLAKVPSYANYRNGQGETPLHAAASTGQTSAVTTLLAAGVDPNILTVKNWTPLHHAARFGHKLALINLLKAGADVYAVNSDGNDAMKLANLALRDSKNEIDSRGCLEYLNLWIQHHPRAQ